MKIYRVSQGEAIYDRSLKDLFGDGTDETGGMLYARSTNWPKPFQGIQEGGIELLWLEGNLDRPTLMVQGLITCSALFYLYMNPNGEGHKIAGALAFHSPSGTRRIKIGNRKNESIEGPIAEAKRQKYNWDPANVNVVIAAGPGTMATYKRVVSEKEFSKAAQAEHDQLLGLLQEEKIPTENILIYCSSTGEFGLNEHGFFGERAAPIPIKQPSIPTTKKKRCYISTATCASLGLPDDCEALNLLRGYRDNVLLRTPQGQRDVETYYATAPAIVAAIDARTDAAAIYRGIFAQSLTPALAAIRSADYARAYALYRELVARLQARFG